MSTLNYREYGYALVSSPLVSGDLEILNSNTTFTESDNQNITLREYSVPEGSRPHDVDPFRSTV